MANSHAQEFMDALHRLESEGDVDGMVALFADDAELSNPTDAVPHRGREGAAKFWRAYRGTLGEPRSEFRHVVVAENVAVFEWVTRGKIGEGEPVEYDGVSVVEWKNGQIRRFRAYFDPAKLQLRVARRKPPAA